MQLTIVAIRMYRSWFKVFHSINKLLVVDDEHNHIGWVGLTMINLDIYKWLSRTSWNIAVHHSHLGGNGNELMS